MNIFASRYILALILIVYVLLAYVIYDTQICRAIITKETCIVTNYESMSNNNVNITFCYESICNSTIKQIKYYVYRISNITCWRKDLIISLDNLDKACNKINQHVRSLVVFAPIFIIILSILLMVIIFYSVSFIINFFKKKNIEVRYQSGIIV